MINGKNNKAAKQRLPLLWHLALKPLASYTQMYALRQTHSQRTFPSVGSLSLWQGTYKSQRPEKKERWPCVGDRKEQCVRLGFKGKHRALNPPGRSRTKARHSLILLCILSVQCPKSQMGPTWLQQGSRAMSSQILSKLKPLVINTWAGSALFPFLHWDTLYYKGYNRWDICSTV